MREIKFRAWDKAQKVMVYDNDRWTPPGNHQCYPVSVSNKGIIFCKIGVWGAENTVKDENGRIGYQEWEYDQYYQDIELMQFTGYKDQIGTDIFEGDILRCHFDDVMKPVNLVVRWQNVGWEPFNSYSDIFLNGYKPNQHLVIGNVYQNPDIEYEKPVIDTNLGRSK